MTNKEAIEILDKCHSGYTQEKVQTAYNMAKEALRAQADKEQPMNITTAIAITKDVMSDYESPITKEALGMAVDALKEKAEKERRYVVMSQFPLQHRVFDTKREVGVADRIATREAAQAIADIYEGMEG